MKRYDIVRMRNVASTLAVLLVMIIPNVADSTQYVTLNANMAHYDERNPANNVQFLRTPGTPTYNTDTERGTGQQSEMIDAGNSQAWTMDAGMSSDTVVDDIHSRLYLQGPMPTPIKIDGTSGDQAGFNVSADDLNDDGISDIIVGTPYEDHDSTDCGAVSVFFGSSSFEDTPPDPKVTKNDADVVVFGENANDNFGWSVAGAHDVNGDGISDMIVGAPHYSSSTGRAYMFYGGTLIGVGGTTTANDWAAVVSGTRQAQSFVPRADMSSTSGALLDEVRVYVREAVEEPVIGIVIEIYADSGGMPSGAPLAASAVIDPFANPTSIEEGWVYWDLSPDLAIYKDTKYWIVVSSADAAGFEWLSRNDDKYGDGTANSDTGAGWGSEDANDRLFSIIPKPGAIITGEAPGDCFGASVAGPGEMGNGGSIYNDGFECGDLSAWTSSTVGAGNSIAAEANVIWYGRYSLGVTMGGSASDAYVEKSYLTSNFPTHYFRFYFMIPSGFTISAGSYWNLGAVVDSAANTRVKVYIENDGGNLKLKGTCYDSSSVGQDIGLAYPSSGGLTAGRWYCVETKIKVSSSAGEVKAYVEGNLESSNAIVNTGTTGVNIKYIRLGSVGSTATITGTIYFDHAAGSTLPAGLAFLDISVGAPFSDNSGRTNNGRAYVFLGRFTSAWAASSPMAASSADVMWNGEMTNGYFGFAVAAGGNVNGDAFDEAVAGAPGCDRAYIYYGSAGLTNDQGTFNHTSYDDFFAQTRINVDALTAVQDAPDGGAALEDLGGTKYRPNNVASPDMDGVPDKYTVNSGTRANTQEAFALLDGLTWNVSESNAPSDATANADLPVVGTVTGTYLETQTSNNVYESITEDASGDASSVVWRDDFETDTGWTGYATWSSMTGEWQRGTPNQKALPTGAQGRQDPAAAHSGSKIIGNDIGVTTADNGVSNGDGAYNNSITTTAYLRSPAITTTGYTGVMLRYYRWLNVQGATNDYAYTEVSNDGTTWTVLYPLASNPRSQDGKWSMEIFNISSVADNRATVYIRFGIKSDATINFTGWNIDDVEIVAGCKMKTYEIFPGVGAFGYSYYGSFSNSQPIPPSGPDITSQTNYTTYTAFAASDNSGIGVTSSSNTVIYFYWHFKFHVNETLSSIKSMTFSWEGYDSYGSGADYVYIWNFSKSGWDQVATVNNLVSVDVENHDSLSSSFSNYIDSSGYFHITALSALGKNTGIYTDYVYVRVMSNMSASLMEHKWAFAVSSASSIMFYMEAYHTSGENFDVYYSVTGVNNVGATGWTKMFTVTATSDPGTYQSYSLPPGTSGTIYIGVIDVDRSSGDTTSNTFYIDHMYIRSVGNPYYDVEFQVTGLTISYSSIYIVFVGHKFNENANIYYWNGASWAQDAGITVPDATGTVVSTTNINAYIFSQTISLKIRSPASDADASSCVEIDWIGVKTNAPSQYAPYGSLTQAEAIVTVNPLLRATATWSADGTTTANQLVVEQATDDGSGYYVDVNRWQAQSFTPTIPMTLTKVSVNAWDVGTVNSFICAICNDDGTGKPNTASALTTTTASLGTTSGWYDINFVTQPTLSPGTTYWIVMEDSSTATNGQAWSFKGSNVYSGGMRAYQNAGVWTTSPGEDFEFRINGTTINLKVYLSRDNGLTWYEVQSGTATTFGAGDSVKNNFLYKVEMWSLGTATPTLHWIEVSYETEVPFRTPTPLFGDAGTSFGWAVSGVGNTDDALEDDVFVGAPDYGGGTGRVYGYFGGDILYNGTGWNDTSQSNFTAAGTNLASANPNVVDNVYATPHGEITLRENTVWFDNFESYALGGEPTPAWTVTDTEDRADIDIANDITMVSGTLGTKITDTVTNAAGIMTRAISPAMTDGVVDMYLYPVTGWINFLILRNGGAGGSYRAQIYANNGNLLYYNGVDNALASSVNGKWVWLRVAFHTGTNTVKIYIDGNLTYSGILANSGTIDTVESGTDNPAIGTGYVDDVKVYTYYSPGTYLSRTITSPGYIASAKITWYADLQGQTAQFYLSRDGGTTWSQPVSNATDYWFTGDESNGKVLRYKIVMSTTNVAHSPMIYNVSITYRYIKVGFTIDGETAGDKFGFSISGSGNNVKDTYTDAMIGAPYYGGTGAAYLFAGRAYVQGTAYTAASDSSGRVTGENAGDAFGWSVYGGPADSTDNGNDEVIIGAALFEANDRGRVYLFESVSPGEIEVKYTYDTYPSTDPQLIGMTTHVFDANRWYLDFLNPLYGVSSSDTNFVAVGKGGIIYRYSGAPAKWDTVTRVRNSDLYAVSLIPGETRGIAVGAGTIQYTSTSGASWSASTDSDIGSSNNYYGVSAVNIGGLRRAWAVGTGGRILYNSDITAAGGGNWIVQTTTGSVLRDVEFYNGVASFMGIAVGAGTILYYSGGVWTASSGFDAAKTYYGVSTYYDAGTTTYYAWAVGSRGAIYRSADGGQSWTAQTSGTTMDIRSVSFYDANNGVAVGMNGLVLRTTDGGTTWLNETRGLDVSNNLYGVQMNSGTLGFLVGNGSWISKSVDNGDTWTKRTVPAGQRITITIKAVYSWIIVLYNGPLGGADSSFEIKRCGDARARWAQTYAKTSSLGSYVATNSWTATYSPGISGYDDQVRVRARVGIESPWGVSSIGGARLTVKRWDNAVMIDHADMGAAVSTGADYKEYEYTFSVSSWQAGLYRAVITGYETAGLAGDNVGGIDDSLRGEANERTILFRVVSPTIGNRVDTSYADFTAAGSAFANTEALSTGTVTLSRSNSAYFTFNSDVSPGNPAGWTLEGTEGSNNYIDVATDQYYGTSGKSVKFVDTTTSNAIGMYTTFGGITKGSIVVYVRMNAAGRFDILPTNTAQAANNPAMQLYFENDGNIYYYNGVSNLVQAYSSGTWYKLEIKFDTTDGSMGRADVYVDDVLRLDNVNFLNFVANINKLSMNTDGNSATTSSTWIDEVRVYTYPTAGTNTYTSAPTTIAGSITGITVSWTTSELSGQPTGLVSSSMQVSRDGGTTWSPALTNGETYMFRNGEPLGNSLVYRFTLSSTDARYTPRIDDVTLTYYYS